MKPRILSALYGAMMIIALLQVNTASAQHLTLPTYSGQSEITASGSITFGPGFTVPSGSNFRAYISSSANCVPLASSASQDQNYIISNTVKQAGITNAGQLAGLNVCDLSQTIQYFDGLGRPIQTVTVKGSPSQKDLVQPVSYDAFGRETTKYLPYADAGTANGSYKTNALTAGQGVLAFYNPAGSSGTQQANGMVRTAYPFRQTVFEPSPLNRVLEQGAPGLAWQPAASRTTTGRTIVAEYGSNTATEVKLWVVNATGASCGTNTYLANKLYKSISKDENWVTGKAGTTEEFKDFEGRVVLKRVWDSETASLSTYYVYDDFGNLRYVIPPGVIVNTFTEAGTDVPFNGFIYAYHYDGRNRLVEKKIPGKGWEYLVYNKLDQVVLTQDAIQRGKASQDWTLTKYDAFGRMILTGIHNYGATAGTSYRSAIQLLVDAQSYQWEERVTTTGNGYTARCYPAAVPAITLSLQYYDEYTTPNLPASYNHSTNSAYIEKPKGLSTASCINVLGTTAMLWTVNFYDKEGRTIKIYKQHYQGGAATLVNYDEISNSYNFAGELTYSARAHKVGATTTNIAMHYEYDNMGRKRATMQSINGPGEVVLAKLEYNEVGQLLKKDLHSTDNGTNFIQSNVYAYNERGWMTKVNDPDNVAANKVFGMELTYANKTDAYNGNIGAVRWQTKVPVGLGLNQYLQSFSYDYDKLNRLTKAGYTTSGSVDKFNEELSYDEMGNISSLKRKNSISGYLNNFTYNYIIGGAKTNRLLGVTDAGTAAQTSNYTYDDNGSQKTDSRKGIEITYNHLNLPKTITKSSTGEVITYTYDAAGNKLRKVFGNNTRDYVGDIEYSNGAIEFILTEEGRALPGGAYTYEYMLKDHLGNMRATVKQNGDIVQVQDYYAFGMEMGSGNTFSPSPNNQYKYNGKEKQPELSLDQLDYGARFYDPVIGRWNVVDPLAEVDRSWSPYNYTRNNPVRFIDPDGMIWENPKDKEIADRLQMGISKRRKAEQNNLKDANEEIAKIKASIKEKGTSKKLENQLSKANDKVASINETISNLNSSAEELARMGSNVVAQKFTFNELAPGSTEVGGTYINEKTGTITMDILSDANAIHEGAHGWQAHKKTVPSRYIREIVPYKRQYAFDPVSVSAIGSTYPHSVKGFSNISRNWVMGIYDSKGNYVYAPKELTRELLLIHYKNNP